MEVTCTVSDLKFLSGFSNYRTNVEGYQAEPRPIFERVEYDKIEMISRTYMDCE